MCWYWRVHTLLSILTTNIFIFSLWSKIDLIGNVQRTNTKLTKVSGHVDLEGSTLCCWFRQEVFIFICSWWSKIEWNGIVQNPRKFLEISILKGPHFVVNFDNKYFYLFMITNWTEWNRWKFTKVYGNVDLEGCTLCCRLLKKLTKIENDWILQAALCGPTH